MSTETEWFKTNNNIFEATTTTTKYEDRIINKLIKIGGQKFKECVNITIEYRNGQPYKAKIPHIQSEPECGFAFTLKEGTTPSMIKAAIQYSQYKFNTIMLFEFDDGSNIDCGITEDKEPPRHLQKPFSLPYLYIALNLKTWYEYHFNAEMIDEKKYKEYRKAIENLNKKIKETIIEDLEIKSYNNFIDIASLSTELQINKLKKYFDTELTWVQFFNTIPKKQRCELLFNWLPSFINKLIDNKFTGEKWVIDYTKINKIYVEIVNPPRYMGGFTRKNKKRKTISFSNNKLRGGGYIFDGSI
jgi:hypothetical protein